MQYWHLAEADYAAFQRKIVSDTQYPIVGVRMAHLRKAAKLAAKDQWRFLADAEQFSCFEDIMVAGLATAYAKVPFLEKRDALWQLLPKLDSWALTDCIAPTLAPKDHELHVVWEFAQACVCSDQEYTVRFGIVLLLRYFLTPEYVDRVAQILCGIQDERYYVQMAVAWCFAEMAVQEYALVEDVLKRGALSRFTHNKTIQKMRESYRILDEWKTAALLLRRKSL